MPRSVSRSAEVVERWLDVAHLCRNHDVLVFGFGSTATDTAFELLLYRALRKRVIFVFHGSDARPPYLNEARAPAGTAIDWEGLRAATHRVARRMRRVEKYADEVLAYPGISHFFTRELVDWYAMGKPLLPFEFQQEPFTPPDPLGVHGGRPFRVGHAPTRRSTKGTDVLVQCVERLRDEGWNVELVLPDGMVARNQVLTLLSGCDVTVDQFWADVPGPTLAAELAALGWPVIVGVREGDFFQETYPDRAAVMRFRDPNGVEDELRTLLEQTAEAPDRRHLTEPFGDPTEVVADRYLSIFLGKDHTRWRFDPTEINRVFGFGPEERVKEIAAGYLQRFGSSELMLDRRPALRAVIEHYVTAGADHKALTPGE